MKMLLKFVGYELKESNVVKNKRLNNFDCILCIAYAVISLINVIIGTGSLKLVNVIGNGQIEIDDASKKTVLLIIVNAIVLIRLNIKLYVEVKEEELCVLHTMQEESKDFVTIKIKTLDRRMRLLYYCYVMDIPIFFINILFFKNGIESSICVLIILPIIITLFNNLIDIAKRKYDVDENISYELRTLEGVSINDNNSN